MAKTKLQEALGPQGDDQDPDGRALREFLKLSTEGPVTREQQEKITAFKKNKDYYANDVRKAKYNG